VRVQHVIYEGRYKYKHLQYLPSENKTGWQTVATPLFFVRSLIILLDFKKMSRHWWLTPVILATQEAEIRRIVVETNGQIVC
jgi:hypothetical protein